MTLLPTEDVCTELTEGDISETVLNLVRHHEDLGSGDHFYSGLR